MRFLGILLGTLVCFLANNRNCVNGAGGLFASLPVIGSGDANPICLLPTSSPQFAELCSLQNSLLGVLGFNIADEICDADCRCTHGATARGGKCGLAADQKTYCICDMRRTPVIPPSQPAAGVSLPLLHSVLENCVHGVVTTAFTALCDVGGAVAPVGDFLSDLCVKDCICSHGFPRGSTNHVCTTNNGDPTNKIPYCVCNFQN